MSGRRYNPQKVKIHHSYDVAEVANLLDVHKNTVRIWIKEGLPVVDSRRPTLILGGELRTFLKSRRVRNKRKCQPGEFYCFGCRAQRWPAGNMVDFQSITEKVGNITALCEQCESVMHQRIAAERLKQLPGEIEITFTQEHKRIVDRSHPSVNSDFKRGR